MQPLAPEPGGRRQPRQSPPPELRLPLPGSAALEAGAGTDGKGRPAHRPQVTRASERGGGGAQRPRRSDPPESRHVTGQTESPGPRRGPPLALAGPRPRRPGPGLRCVPTCGASAVPRTVPCWAPGQGHLRERGLAWEPRDLASNPWPLSHCFLNCESRISNPSPTSLGGLGGPQIGFGGSGYVKMTKSIFK